MVKKILLLLAASIFLVFSSSATAESDSQLDAVVERAMRRHGVPGASVAVMENGVLAWAKGYGLADPGQGIAVSPDTIFEAASIAKPVTAWGVMSLVERGALDLDAPIDQYLSTWHLPPSEFDHDQITIRRILSHTAGLSTDGDTGVDPGQYLPTREEALDGAILGMRPLHVAYPPGDDYHYSSIGYTLLELAVEEVTGEPFEDYMQREILDPLGMESSSYGWTPELRQRAAVGHNWYNQPLPQYQYSTKAQGGLLTTPTDLVTFMMASLPGPNGEPVGRGVLTPESVAEILSPVSFASEAESSHISGLGFDLLAANEKLVGARKTGDHRGFKPLIAMAYEEGDGIAIMTNSDRAAIGFIMEVACTWSSQTLNDPLLAGCKELSMIRNIQLGIAGVLAFAGIISVVWYALQVRSGRRELRLDFSGKVLRIAIPLVLMTAWWVFWHTDFLLTRILQQYPCCGYAVTVRAFVPWPTAFVWISWAVTFWLLVWITTGFAPKVKKSS